MGKSYKKAIIKDNGGHNAHKLYHRTVRGGQNNYLRSNLDKFINDEDVVIPDEKTLFNDYDYCDYKFDNEHCKGGR